MGTTYKVYCSECGYCGQFHLGGGINSNKLPFILRCLSDKDKLRLQELQEHGINTAISENHIIKRCSCDDGELLREALIVNVTDKSGMLHIFGNSCTNCGEALEILDISKPVLCPKCSEAKLTLNIVGHWD
ncbi:MAG: hypothetical protein E7478_08810 [Ruminococcaceae bacterium]|nr:hypothetical protein [Oscillospiraceae bacterium]